MKDATVHREACRLMSDHRITTRCEQLRRRSEQAFIAATLSDKERVLRKLRDLLESAEGTPAENTMLRAADLLGRSVGLFKDVQVHEPAQSAAEVQAELEDKLKALGIWQDTEPVTH